MFIDVFIIILQLPVNLYLRYFDRELLVSNVDEALDFLSSISEINMTRELEKDLRDYAAANVYYPKRYKVRPRVYFIVIKTEAQTMEDFKAKKALRPMERASKGESPIIVALNDERYGWYEGKLDFKRVVVSPATGKCEYRDTQFVAQCKAMSGLDAYNRICDHLLTRVDSRSQFPSPKGKNYSFKFLGACKPEA